MISATYTKHTAYGFEHVETRHFGTERAAEMWASDVLKGQDVITTNENYWRDLARCSDVRLYRKGGLVREITPPVHVHMSIGERGY